MIAAPLGSVKRLSIDCKATVHIGAYSRGGLTRGDNQASDHDMGCKEKYVPCGIVDEDSAELTITFGSSYKTSDFIVDALAAKWDALEAHEKTPRVCCTSKWIMARRAVAGGRNFCIAWCSSLTTLTSRFISCIIRRISKYNPIERCWGILELKWNGTKLSDAETMLEWAKRDLKAASDRRTQPQSLPKGHCAREGGNAGG